MAYGNQEIRIEGYIGADVVDMLQDKKGKAYARFSVGVVTSKNQSQWFSVYVYGEKGRQLIEKCRIKKGLECYVRGVLSISSYFNKKAGKTLPSIAIFADNVFIQEKILTKEQKKDLEKANEIDKQVSDETVSDLEEAPF